MDIKQILSYSIKASILSCEVGENVASIWNIDLDNNTCLVIFSAWRLECNDLVLITNEDATTIGKERTLGIIKRVEGKQLLSLELSEQYDLILNFEDHYTIKTFSNISYYQTENGGDWDANWRFGIPELNIIGCATNHFEMKFEKFDDNAPFIMP